MWPRVAPQLWRLLKFDTFNVPEALIMNAFRSGVNLQVNFRRPLAAHVTWSGATETLPAWRG